MKEYNVLWIDDQYTDQQSFLLVAAQNNIIISPYITAKEGIEAFKKDINKWDAIILDAKGYYESTDEVATTKGMYNSIYEIESLSYQRSVPIFILSGQGDLYDDEQFSMSLRGKRIYKKGSPKDQKELFADIKDKADCLIENQIIKDNKELFDSYPNLKGSLIKIFMRLYKRNTTDTEVFISIRKILEFAMQRLHELGYSPIKCHGANLNSCKTFFLRGEMNKYIPLHIQASLDAAVDISNDGAHRMEVDNVVRTGHANYLIRSTTYELMNILEWITTLPSDEDSIHKMLNITKEFAGNSGIIEKDEDGNYHCGNCLLNHQEMSDDDIGKEVLIIKQIENKNTHTKITYPFFTYRNNMTIFE